ncbi:mitochondrial-processing peptidase subunit beta-like [Anopheles cruzii]|uniref:mitochondrial-processing peptidase subunit beta-like n=1 Tax=Anopheles cruzii TaxID=68878 RepID=UPI0022EC738C|nr:mitochondrial-processing peptidase subunit beta-like [Anopheles cruzii]
MASLLKISANLRSPALVGARAASSYAAAFKSALSNEPATEVTTLDSGLRVASETLPTQLATVGLYVDAGSRYEDKHNNGTANFFEHVAFKGTTKRSQSAFEQELESLGASVDATTGREETVFQARCLSKDVPKVVELLADVVQNPKLDDGDVKRAREVLLGEMEQVAAKNLRSVVFDHLHATAYQGTSLANSVWGPTANVRGIKRDDLRGYVASHFQAPRMVLAVAGDVRQTELEKLAQQHLGKVGTTFDGKAPALSPVRYTGSEVRVRDDSVPLAHVAVAVQGCGVNESDALPLSVAASLIGSWDRSHGAGVNSASKLAVASAHDKLSHNFESFNLTYRDTGLWGIYFVCDPLACEDMLFNVQNEWMRLCTMVTDGEVERAKRQLKTTLLADLEGPRGICEDIGRQVLRQGRRDPLHELERRIENVSAGDVRNVAMKYIFDRCPAVAAVGPVENLPDYMRIRSSMSWVRL